jgi:hypothetical protein
VGATTTALAAALQADRPWPARAAALAAVVAVAEQVSFCHHRFPPTGELGYRGAVGLGYRSTV